MDCLVALIRTLVPQQSVNEPTPRLAAHALLRFVVCGFGIENSTAKPMFPVSTFVQVSSGHFQDIFQGCRRNIARIPFASQSRHRARREGACGGCAIVDSRGISGFAKLAWCTEVRFIRTKVWLAGALR